MDLNCASLFKLSAHCRSYATLLQSTIHSHTIIQGLHNCGQALKKNN
jgi:hypothetical protein